MKTTNKLERNRILIYIGITFVLTWIYCLVLVYPVTNHGRTLGVTAQLLLMVIMFFPSIGVLLTRLITKEGFRESWLRPKLKGNIKFYLLAWFGPVILSALGAVLYFLLVKGSFDPTYGYMDQTLRLAGSSLEDLPMSPNLYMLVQSIQGLLLAPIVNFVTCFGEEWGWRGYLLPKMNKLLPTIPTLLVTGVIWGLWHAPLTIIGHNYGLDYPGYPFAGIAMMCLFCITFGIFISYVTLKTGSCIPAIVAHGAVNGNAGASIYFTANGGNPFVGPIPTGIISMLPALLVAVFLLIRLKKKA